MAEKTLISWCDMTWSPWFGCTQVSMGDQGACEHCYARQMWEHRFHRVVFGGPGRGEGTRDVRAESAWNEPRRWNRDKPGSFVFPSHCDPFDNHPDLAEPRRRFFRLMFETPHLTWLPLTKRPGNILKFWGGGEGGIIYRPRNVAIGFTAVTQEEFDRDWPKAKAAFEAIDPPFVFVSCEPLFGRIILPPDFLALGPRAWIIAGGESDQGAHRARPSDPDWFRRLRDDCLAAGVIFQFKQWGEWQAFEEQVPTNTNAPVHRFGARKERLVFRFGKKLDPCTLDGVRHDARPEVRA